MTDLNTNDGFATARLCSLQKDPIFFYSLSVGKDGEAPLRDYSTNLIDSFLEVSCYRPKPFNLSGCLERQWKLPVGGLEKEDGLQIVNRAAHQSQCYQF